jgi:hypothetical protein
LSVTWNDVRRIGLTFDNVEVSTSYGTPALKQKKKLLIRLKEDGETIVAIIGFDNRDMLMEIDTKTFFTTDHYNGYPSVLVRLARITRDQARDVIAMAVKHRSQATGHRSRDRSQVAGRRSQGKKNT